MAKYFTEEHEWIEVEGDTATLGITEHAAEALGDVVFVELKEEGDEFEQGDEIGVIESVKAASEIFAPISCEILEVNESLADTPASINESPEGDAWLYKIKVLNSADLEGLMDEAAYKLLIG
ncbi:MAG TPA: glycine cleavage system protein GcvH [Paracoccaceae bacterium]|nr:glycine cleavage system protein GcvH [Paracoccaceae bacterium]